MTSGLPSGVDRCDVHSGWISRPIAGQRPRSPPAARTSNTTACAGSRNGAVNPTAASTAPGSSSAGAASHGARGGQIRPWQGDLRARPHRVDRVWVQAGQAQARRGRVDVDSQLHVGEDRVAAVGRDDAIQPGTVQRGAIRPRLRVGVVGVDPAARVDQGPEALVQSDPRGQRVQLGRRTLGDVPFDAGVREQGGGQAERQVGGAAGEVRALGADVAAHQLRR